MTRRYAVLLALTLALGSVVAASAHAAASLGLFAPNHDNTRATKWRNGNKPIDPPAVCPSGWVCATKGTGFGEVDEVSSTTFDFVAGGNSATNGFKYVYKDVASGDFQLKARITDSYSPGSLGNFAGLGLTISDGTEDAEVVYNGWSPHSTSAIARSIAGTPGGATTAVNGAPGTRAEWLCIGYDESETEARFLQSEDGTNWIAVSEFDNTFSTPIVGLFAQSGSTTQEMSATADNIELRTGSTAINCWTPPQPPPPQAPVLVTPMANLSCTQGQPCDFPPPGHCLANWTGAASFSLSGLAAGTGLSFNATTCELNGSPDADDVGTRNLTLTATNANGSTQDSFSLTVTGSGGQTFGPYGSGVRTINCTADETQTIKGKGAGPGDTILLDGGNRGPLTIQQCNGSASSKLKIYNDVNDNSPTVFGATQSATFILEINSVSNIEIGRPGGGAKYAGGPAGWCGVSEDDNSDQDVFWLDDGDTYCGFVSTRPSGTTPTAYVKVGGLSTKWTIQSIEVDGLNLTTPSGGSSRIGISINDHGVKGPEHGCPGPDCFWREDLNLLHVVVRNAGNQNGGEGVYFGPNGYGEDGGNVNDLPLRRARIGYTLVDTTSKEGLNPKYWLQGPNFIDHNHVYNAGQGTGFDTNAGRHGINMVDGGDVDIHSNYVENSGHVGIVCGISSAVVDGISVEPDVGPYYCKIYNNFVVRPGSFLTEVGDCFRASRVTATGNPHPGTRAQYDPVEMYNNTCITPDGDAFEITSSINGSKSIRDNLTSFGSCGGDNAKITPASAAGNNICRPVGDHNFVNQAGDDYHLTSGSPARDTGTNQAPPLDYDGDTRPKQNANDRGADEFAP